MFLPFAWSNCASLLCRLYREALCKPGKPFPKQYQELVPGLYRTAPVMGSWSLVCTEIPHFGALGQELLQSSHKAVKDMGQELVD